MNKHYETKEGKTQLQGALVDKKVSALKKYQAINIGSTSFIDLIKYEFYSLFIAPLPGAIGYLLRKLFLKLLLAECGSGLVVGRSVTIRHPGKIKLKANVLIDDYAVLDAKGETNQGIDIGNDVLIGRSVVLSCKNGDITIGDNANIALGSFIQSAKTVTIGNKVLFAAYCYVIGGGDHNSDRVDIAIMDQGQIIKGISIDDNVWLGAGVKVVDGVNVGRDSILGAGSVITKDVADYSVVVGIPGRVLYDRREKVSENV